MIQKTVLTIAIFLVILLALSFGETAFTFFFSWVNWLTGSAIKNFSELFYLIKDYVHDNGLKVIIALALTIPISYWISRRQKQETSSRAWSKRKLSIFLALFLGWIGIHRFYIGHYFWGLVYIILFMVFAPASVLLALIDAVRFFSMNDDEFELVYR